MFKKTLRQLGNVLFWKFRASISKKETLPEQMVVLTERPHKLFSAFNHSESNLLYFTYDTNSKFLIKGSLSCKTTHYYPLPLVFVATNKQWYSFFLAFQSFFLASLLYPLPSCCTHQFLQTIFSLGFVPVVLLPYYS